MGSGTLFDPINSIEAFGLGEFNQESAEMSDIPDVSSSTGAILDPGAEGGFSESEESTVRKNVTKKRLGTKQARIPLQADSIAKEE